MKVRKKRNDEEYNSQVALFEWAEHNIVKYPDLEFMFSTLNGVKLPIGLAVKMKKAGNKKGVPDIWLPVPRGFNYCGMVIELKKEKGGTVSKEQKVWLKKLSDGGWCSCVCEGFKEAQEKVEWYLKLK